MQDKRMTNEWGHERVDSIECPHCGRIIANTPILKYQVYEMRVAVWLKGKLPPILEPDFDVYECEFFPNLTFQVKYSTLGRRYRRGTVTGETIWTWKHRKLRDSKPDYFVLCGIHDDQSESWFVLPRRAVVKHGGSSNGGLLIQGNSRRFSSPNTERYKPGCESMIWQYHCPDPVKMVEHVLHQEKLYQLSLL